MKLFNSSQDILSEYIFAFVLLHGDYFLDRISRTGITEIHPVNSHETVTLPHLFPDFSALGERNSLLSRKNPFSTFAPYSPHGNSSEDTSNRCSVKNNCFLPASVPRAKASQEEYTCQTRNLQHALIMLTTSNRIPFF